MNRPTLDLLYAYTYWAHHHLWPSILDLSDEQYTRELGYSWGSIHAQAVHTMSAEWIWLQRLKGHTPPAMFSPSDFPTRAGLRTRWDALEMEMMDFIGGLSDEDIRAPFTYRNTKGAEFKNIVGHILLHVANHGTDHRAQMLSMIHRLGGRTVEQDIPDHLQGTTDLPTLQLLFRYTYWAHQRVWACVESLTDAQFKRDIGYSWGSVHAQVLHMMEAEWIWLQRLKGFITPDDFTTTDFPTRASIRSRWDALEIEIWDYLNHLTPDDLQGTFSYTNRWRATMTESVSKVLLHVVNHGTDHRAQTLAMIGEMGGATVEQDLVFMLR